MTVATFAEALYHYCRATAASITSAGRTEQHNRTVGGASRSAHLAHLAADVIYDEIIPVGERRRLATSLNLLLIAEDDHDHLQPENWIKG